MSETDNKIKRIDIVFENCESVKLYPHMFTGFMCEEISKTYWINCYQYENGEVCGYLRCKYFYIFINKKGLKTKTEIGGVGSALKDRLKHKDITHIDIIFEDRNEYVSVPWQGENYTNELQKHEVFKDGLTIEIKEK